MAVVKDTRVLSGRAVDRARTMTRPIRIAAVPLLICAFAVATRASELSDELAARRARVMARLGPETMLVLWSAPTRTYSLDIEYEYRQDSNLYYLTGVTQ